MRIQLSVALLLCALAVGCGRRRTVIVREDPHGNVTVIRVHHAPPPPPPAVTVVKVKRPGRHHVWVKGHYVWRSRNYVWVKGHWVKPPRRGVVWVPGHWRRTPQGGVWMPGHWR